MFANDENGQVIYILKSSFYPDFRQKSLSILSLPNNLSFTIEYDQKWLSADIKTNLKQFKGKTVCLIFIDYSSSKPKFYPLRKCKIHDIIPPNDGVTYQLLLTTDNLIVPIDSKKFNSEVYKLLQQKNLIKNYENNEIVSNLVFYGDKTILDLTSNGGNQQNIWSKLVEYLTGLNDIKRLEDQPQFRESIFFRLSLLSRSKLKSSLTPKKQTYKLNQGKEYTLAISVYIPHYKNFPKNEIRKLVFDFDSKLISHVGSIEIDLPLAQRKYTKHFNFRVKETITGGKSNFVIHGDRSDFNSPNVQIPFEVSTMKKNIIGVICALGTGIFILGAYDILTNAIVSFFEISETGLLGRTGINLAFAFIGTALSTLPIAWLELKRRII